MEYWLYLPAVVKKSPMPLLVMLHGCEQSAPQFAEGSRMNLLAEKKGFAVLYPQQSRKANPNRCWNWYDKATQDGGGDVKVIVEIMQKVLLTHPIDPTRIYIAGMSAGAALANIIALEFPQLVAAVGLHSGAAFGAAHSALGALAVMQGVARNADSGAMQIRMAKSGNFSGMPAILIHGERDYVVRSVNMAQTARQFRILNQVERDGSDPVISDHPPVAGGARSRNAYKTFDYYADRRLMVRVCEIAQLDHAWSGGDCNLRFNACKGPDASLLMWNFFAPHRRIAQASAHRLLPVEE